MKARFSHMFFNFLKFIKRSWSFWILKSCFFFGFEEKTWFVRQFKPFVTFNHYHLDDHHLGWWKPKFEPPSPHEEFDNLTMKIFYSIISYKNFIQGYIVDIWLPLIYEIINSSNFLSIIYLILGMSLIISFLFSSKFSFFRGKLLACKW